MTDLILRMTAAGLVILLAWAAAHFLRRRPLAERAPSRGLHWLRSSPGQKTLHSEARLALTPQHSLHVVRVGARRYLLSTHPAGLSTIAELSASDITAGDPVPAQGAGEI
jgi:flagellar biogenesis protein FliO